MKRIIFPLCALLYASNFAVNAASSQEEQTGASLDTTLADATTPLAQLTPLASPKTPGNSNTPPELQRYLESKLDQLSLGYRQCAVSLEACIQLINAGKAKLSKEAKEKALEEINNVRIMLTTIQKSMSSIVPTVGDIAMFNTLLQAITNHVQIWIHNQFSVVEPFDLQAVMAKMQTRAPSQTPSPEALDSAITSTLKNIEKLDKESLQLGLSRMNRAYRATEKFWTDYKMNRNILIGASASFLGYYLLSRADSDVLRTLPGGSVLDNIKNFTPGTKPLIGTAPYETLNDYGVTVKIPATGVLTTLESFLRDRLRFLDINATPYFFWASIYAAHLTVQSEKVQAWFSEKISNLGRKLRGEKAQHHIGGGLLIQTSSPYTFDDYYGKEDLKNKFDDIINYLIEPARFVRTGQTIPHLIFCGKTRAGKTFFAKCVLGQALKKAAERGLDKNIRLIPLSAAQLNKPGGLEAALWYIKYDNVPTILVIDEIDMMNLQRDKNSDALCQALTALSGINTEETGAPLIIIGTTNLPENIDQALLQPGRFGSIVWFNYPTQEERLQFIVNELDKRGALAISKEFIVKFALETHNHSFEDIKAVINSAIQKSKGRTEPLNEYHLEEALDEELRHIVYDTHIDLNDSQKKLVAAHIAGSAIITHIEQPSNMLCKATIRALTKSIKEQTIFQKIQGNDITDNIKNREIYEYGALFTTQTTHVDRHIATQQDRIAAIKVLVAGSIAEQILFDTCSYSYRADQLNKAFDQVKDMVCEGIDTAKLSKHKQAELQDKAFEQFNQIKQDVEKVLRAHKQSLENISKALVDNNTLTGDEIVTMIKESTKV